MKTLLAMLIVSFSHLTAAGALQHGDLVVYQAKVEVEHVSDGTAHLVVTMKGCADRLLGYSHQIIQKEDRSVLAISALAVFNDVSTRVRCERMPSQRLQIEIPEGAQLELEHLKFRPQSSEEV
jgi:hypothetical protein